MPLIPTQAVAPLPPAIRRSSSTRLRAVAQRTAPATATAAARTVLLVSYHFPPDNRVGAVRPAKFAKYLTRFGWRPVVLTVKTKHIPVQEPQRLREVSTIQIVRTTVWPTALELLYRLRRAVRRLIGSPASPVSVDPPLPNHGASAPADDPRSFARKLLQLLFEFPDIEVGWVLPAIWQGYRVIRRERIGVLMVTSPPRSSVLIGMVLSWLTGCVLITDLRDPWFSTGVRGARPSRTDRVRAWVERRLMQRSNAVITTADLYTQWLRTEYASLPPGKFHTITNGYDAEDFDRIESLEPDGRFRLTYLGTFYWTRTPRPFLAALSQLIDEGVLPRECVQVNFIGHVATAVGESVADVVRAHGLEECVTLRGVVPYRQSLAEMKRADVLLLLAPDEQYYGIPAKTFEYLAVGRPILCLGGKGATANLIKDSGAGTVVDVNDIEGIKAAIATLFAQWHAGGPAPAAFDRGAFERSKLTRDLIEVIGLPS